MSGFTSVDIDGVMVGTTFPVRVMSVINLSPESFYKGAVADTPDKFREMVETSLEEGADIIDIGAASTAPKHVYGTRDTSISEEIRRVTQALDSIEVSKYPPLSIDTTSSQVAEVALDLGVSMVNDISGLHADSKMAKLVADHEVPIVLMANCGVPCGGVQASLDSLKDSLTLAERAGIRSERIIIDPGIGFGKPPERDVAILQELHRFVELDHPLLVGVSRKAFIGHILDQPDPDDRLVGSLAATTIAVMNGANVIRTHDVKETKLAIKMTGVFL
ncbi:MAG: dihydropteroate synthase [Candidatus Thorarchaeota archaeon]